MRRCCSAVCRICRSSIPHSVKGVRDAFAARERNRGCLSDRVIHISVPSGAVGHQSAIADSVVTGMSKIAADSPGLARAFQQRQRCLLCRLPSVAIELSDRRPAPTKATPPILVSTVFGHCETPLRKSYRDHDITFAKTSDTGCWRKRRPGCWFLSFSEQKVVKQSSVQVQT